MKTAISMNDELLQQADRAAEKMQVSRSRLISLAVEQYLRQRESEEVVRRLNEVYGGESGAPERAMAAKTKAKFRTVIKDRW